MGNDKKGPPTVVWLSGTYPPSVCGIADGTYFLSHEIARCGLDVAVWTQRRPDTGINTVAPLLPPSARPVPVVEVADSWSNEGMRALCRRVIAEQPSLIHLQYESAIYNNNPRLGLLAVAARRAGTALVTTFHALDGPKKRWKRAHRLALIPLLYGSQHLLVCAPRQHRALQRLPRLAPKSYLIPTGNNIPVVAAAASPRPPVPGRPLELVYFGFVWHGKNIETAIDALAAVRRYVPDADARLSVVGEVREPSYQAELMRRAAEKGVADQVRFSGDLSPSQISLALQAADMALLPFPTGLSTGRGTLMAALAHGLPLVAMSRDVNMSPLFRHGENMLLASADDADTFIAECVRLARDGELRAHLARGAAQLADEFSWTRIVAQMRDLPAYRAAEARANSGTPASFSEPAPPRAAA